MDAYTITYVTYGSENPIFAIVAPSNGMPAMPMPMAMPPVPMGPVGQNMQVPFGQFAGSPGFAMPMGPMGPMVPMGPMALPPMPAPNVSWPIYADFNSVPCFSDMSGHAGYTPNYMTDSKVAIVEVEEEPEPEDGGLEASQTSGMTANQTLDKTSEMMRSLAQKLETDKQLWSELQLASDSTEPEKAMIEINTPRKAEKSHGLGSEQGLEILSMSSRGRPPPTRLSRRSTPR